MENTTESGGAARRTVLLGSAGALAVGVTACGAEGEGRQDGSGYSTSPSSSTGPTSVKAADVPVGGGVVLTDANVVVTQPEKGEFKAFSAVCTHRSCTVSAVQDGRIHCPCHLSEFDIATGAPLAGPAKVALPAQGITVAKGTITLGQA